MSQPNETQPFDLGTLSSSELPDLTLINQPKLSLNLGSLTDLSVSLAAELQQQQTSDKQPEQPNHEQQRPQTQQAVERYNSRRWTSLSELGRAVLKPSLSRSNLRLGSLNEQSSSQHRITPSRRLSDNSHSGPTPSIYSSYRNSRNLFKLWSHDSTIECSPAGSPRSSPSNNTFPSLPPMSELLGGSTTFDQQDLSSITEPLSLAYDENQPPTTQSIPIPSVSTAALPVNTPLPISLPSSPSPSSSCSLAGLPASDKAVVLVQSPTMVDPQDLALPETPSFASCHSSPMVPTIERVLSNTDGETSVIDKPSGTMIVDSPTLSAPVSGGGGDIDGKDGASEEPAATETMKADGQPPINNPVHATLSRTHLTGMLGRKKKTSHAGSGSGTPGFFKLFLLKGLGLKSSSSSSSTT